MIQLTLSLPREEKSRKQSHGKRETDGTEHTRLGLLPALALALNITRRPRNPQSCSVTLCPTNPALIQPTRGGGGGLEEGTNTGYDGYSANKQTQFPIGTGMLVMVSFWNQLTIVNSLKPSRYTASREDAGGTIADLYTVWGAYSLRLEDAGGSIADLQTAQQLNKAIKPTSLEHVCSRMDPRGYFRLLPRMTRSASFALSCLSCMQFPKEEISMMVPPCSSFYETRKGQPERVDDTP